MIGALTAAAYLLIGRRLRRHLSLLTYTTVVYSTSALFLLAVMAAAGDSLLGFSPRIYVLLVLMALGPQLLGHSSFNWALGFLPASYVAVTIISEPIGAGHPDRQPAHASAGGRRPPSLIKTDGEHALQIVLREDPKRDERF